MCQLLPQIEGLFDEINREVVSRFPEKDKAWMAFMGMVDDVDNKARLAEERLLASTPGTHREILRDAFSRKKNHDRTLAGYIGEILAGGKPDRHFEVLLALDVLDFSILLMDDILDRAERRAERAAFHKKWGLPKAGMAIMVLKGLSNTLVLESLLSEMLKNRIIKELEDIHLKVYEGQFLDNKYENINIEDIGMDDYLKMVQLTTGWQVAKAFRIGGILAGTDEGTNQILERFGLITGTLGQIRDDIIDYLPEERTWKTPFLDFRDGKKRFPLVFVWHELSPEQKKRIYSLQGKDRLADAERIEIVDILFGKDHLIKMRKFMSGMRAEAEEILGQASLNPEAVSLTKAFLSLMSGDVR